MSRAFARAIVEQGDGGSIVNISSIAGKIIGANAAAYSASKAGIHSLTCSMASELGRAGVRVNAICPGIIDTYRMDDIPRGQNGTTWWRARCRWDDPAPARKSRG